MKKAMVLKLEKYLKELNSLEEQIEDEKKKQEKFEEEKKLLICRIKALETRFLNVESRIDELNYRIYSNKLFMKKYKRSYIKNLARISVPLTTSTFIGTLIATRGLSSILSLGTLASSVGASLAISYSIYSIFMNSYQKREKENEIFSEEIKKLQEEKVEIFNEISLSKKQIIDIEKQVSESKDNCFSLENKIIKTVNEWNEQNGKEFDNIPQNSKKSDYPDGEDLKNIKEIEAKVLKLIPKEIQSDLKKVA